VAVTAVLWQTAGLDEEARSRRDLLCTIGFQAGFRKGPKAVLQ
jgi:hypothetical protein